MVILLCCFNISQLFGAQEVESLGVPEQDLLRLAPEITLDGNLDDWRDHPFSPLGMNSLSEVRLSGVLCAGWSDDALLLGFDVFLLDSSLQGTLKDDVLDLFVDIRPRTARMERYEPGVTRLRIFPFHASDDSWEILAITGQENEQETSWREKCSASFVKGERGWSGEVRIPWGALGAYRPTIGEWIGLSVRISRKDELGNELHMGAESIERRNPLEASPLAFSAVQIAPAFREPSKISFRVEETVIAGKPWLDLEAVSVANNGISGDVRLSIDVPAAELRAEIPFCRSSSGKFVFAADSFPLNPNKILGNIITVILTVRGTPDDWKQVIRVPVRVTAAFAEIDERLPDREIKKLPPEELGMASVLKACALETATKLCTAADESRASQRRFRSIFEPGLYDDRISLFVDFAQRLLAGEKIGTEFPFRAWRSVIDGQWLPVKILYPRNYDSKQTYPLRLLVFGRDNHRSRAQFMESDLRAIRLSQFASHYSDSFSIVLFNRSNDEEDMEREILDIFFNGVLASLPVDAERFTIYGGSAGAPAILAAALNHPSRFASIFMRAGEFGGGISTDLLENLQHSAFYLMAGDTDGRVTEATRELHRRLAEGGILCFYDELVDTRHQFAPWDLPPEISRHRLPSQPETISLITRTPEYGNAFWITVEDFIHWGLPAQVQGAIHEQEVIVSARNVRTLSIDRSVFVKGSVGRSLVVNSRQIPLPSLSSDDPVRLISSEFGRAWRQAPPAPEEALRKKQGSSGPSWRIEKRRGAIIYGTQGVAADGHLRRRAVRILKERFGSGPEQLCVGGFDLLSDQEFDPTIHDQWNLWLVGGPDENLVVQLLADRLPLIGTSAATYLTRKVPVATDTLLSYVYPLSKTADHYVYVEIGSSPRAYLAQVFPERYTDISIQGIDENGSVRIIADNFSTAWEVR